MHVLALLTLLSAAEPTSLETVQQHAAVGVVVGGVLGGATGVVLVSAAVVTVLSPLAALPCPRGGPDWAFVIIIAGIVAFSVPPMLAAAATVGTGIGGVVGAGVGALVGLARADAEE